MEQLVHMTLFAGASDVFKAAGKTSGMSQGLEHQKPVMKENAIELVRHAIADDPHILIHEIAEICYFSHGTIH